MNRCSLISWLVFGCALGGLVVVELGPAASHAQAQRRGDDDEEPRGEGRGGGWRRFRREGGGDDERRERFLRMMRERENAGDEDEAENQDRRRGGRNRGDRGRDDRDEEGRDSEQRDNDGGDDENGNRQGRRRGGRRGFDPAEFARMRVSQLDTNGNMTLEGDELEGLPGPLADADANGDKVITVDELIARMSNRGRSSAQESNNQNQQDGASNGTAAASANAQEKPKAPRVYVGAAGGAAAAKEGDANTRRTYRFTPASERLPAALPAWFRMRDRNGDGQVTMNEYSRVWSRRMVNEYLDYDLNSDGVITPKEAQAAEADQ